MIEHKKLIEYLPPFLAEYREYRRLFAVLQAEEDAILQRVDKALTSTYIAIADGEGVARWEGMLGIVPNAQETLEDRRESIKMKLAGSKPYTYRKLVEILDGLLGEGEYQLNMVPEEFRLTVLVELTSRFQQEAVDNLLKRIVPANMICIVGVRYRQYGELKPYSHEDLSAYTYYDLREGVIT